MNHCLADEWLVEKEAGGGWRGADVWVLDCLAVQSRSRFV